MIYIFDMDGTLTPPRLPMTDSFAKSFLEWLSEHKAYIATGSDFQKANEQLPLEVIKAFTGVYCSMGNVLRKSDVVIYEKSFKEPKGLLEELENFRRKTDYPGQLYDNYIEARVGMLNFSVLGRNCPYLEREKYSQWDKDHQERKKIQSVLQSKFPELEITVGGSISIDITPKGCGKGQIAHHIRSQFPEEEIVFLGDRTFLGGNDYELAKELTLFKNTSTVQVYGPDHVLEILSND